MKAVSLRGYTTGLTRPPDDEGWVLCLYFGSGWTRPPASANCGSFFFNRRCVQSVVWTLSTATGNPCGCVRFVLKHERYVSLCRSLSVCLFPVIYVSLSVHLSWKSAGMEYWKHHSDGNVFQLSTVLKKNKIQTCATLQLFVFSYCSIQCCEKEN